MAHDDVGQATGDRLHPEGPWTIMSKEPKGRLTAVPRGWIHPLDRSFIVHAPDCKLNEAYYNLPAGVSVEDDLPLFDSPEEAQGAIECDYFSNGDRRAAPLCPG